MELKNTPTIVLVCSTVEFRRNRRAMNHRSHLAWIPIDKLFADHDDILVYTPKSSAEYAQFDDPFDQTLDNPVIISLSQRCPGLDEPR